MSEPVTREELIAALGASEARTAEKLDEKLEQMETRLRREFYKWARPTAIHIRQHGENIRHHDELLAMIEERLQELESKH